MELLHCERDCGDLLNELCSDAICQRGPARSCHENTRILSTDPSIYLHPPKEVEHLFRLLRFVALIVLPDYVIRRRVQNACLYCRRAHVQANTKLGAHCASASFTKMRERWNKLASRSMRFDTCSTNCAAIPAIPSTFGT